MQSQTPSPSDVPEEVIRLLNDADKGVVGITKPNVQHITDEGLSYRTEREAALADGDFNNLDNGF